jgi:cytochrome b subunit of formate dehydrogenase
MSKTIVKQKLNLISALRVLVYTVALLCVVIQAITGFIPVLRGEHISGYPVMIHATFAPVLAVCLAVLAVLWAGRCRFTQGDWPWFERLVQRVTGAESSAGRQGCKRSALVQKVTFWLLVFLALPLILSIIVSMFPLVGTHGQKCLLALHRNTAIVFVLVAVVHTCTLVLSRSKK